MSVIKRRDFDKAMWSDCEMYFKCDYKDLTLIVCRGRRCVNYRIESQDDINMFLGDGVELLHSERK